MRAILCGVCVLLSACMLQRQVLEPGTTLCLPDSDFYIKVSKWANGKIEQEGWQQIDLFKKGHVIPKDSNWVKFSWVKFGRDPNTPADLKILIVKYEDAAHQAFDPFKGVALEQCDLSSDGAPGGPGPTKLTPPLSEP